VVFYISQPILLFCVPYKINFTTLNFLVLYSTYPNPSFCLVFQTKLISALCVFSVVFYISQPIFLFSVANEINFGTLCFWVWCSTYPNPSFCLVFQTKLISALCIFSVVFYIFQPIFLFSVANEINFGTLCFLVLYSTYPNPSFCFVCQTKLIKALCIF